jgi:hypothetical protein
MVAANSATGYYALLQTKQQVEAKNFVLHLGTTDERSQWCNRLPRTRR